MKKYVFDDFNGDNGDVTIFDTAEEAMAFAEREWKYLTNMDKARYHKENGWFAVYEIEIPESNLQEYEDGYGLPLGDFCTRDIKDWFENK